jgi:hypothetical protein
MLPPQTAPPGTKRPVPNYDGRHERPLSAGEVLVWIPRVLLFPIHATLEYGIRWPAVKLITFAEEDYLVARVRRAFTWRGGRSGLLPTAFYEFGLKPSVGFYFFSEELWNDNHGFTAQAGYLYPSWFAGELVDTVEVLRDATGTIRTRVAFSFRPDRPFNGLGPDPSEDSFYYRERRTDVGLTFISRIGRFDRISIGARYRNLAMSEGQEPSVDAPESPFVVGPGGVLPTFGGAYDLVGLDVEVELDSRGPRGVTWPGSGLRLELIGGYAFDPLDPNLQYLRYGGEAAAFWDITGLNHVLAARLYVRLLESLDDRALPVTERIMLGGVDHLRGFSRGRIRGDSALVASLDYRYPIWFSLDATLFVSTGNAFLGRFENVHVKRMVLCWGLGFRSIGTRRISFDLLVAFGTNQYQHWDEGFAVDNVRFVIGLNRGY